MGYKFAFLFICCLVQQIKGQQVDVASNIRQVTIFQSGAQVLREAEINLAQGENAIVFKGLTQGIDVNSIQVKADQEILILSVRHQYNYQEPPVETEPERQRNEAIENLKSRVDRQKAMLEVLLEEEKLLATNDKIGSSQTGMDVSNLQAAAAFWAKRHEYIKIKRLDINDNGDQ